ncbi:MAG: hypothetical protein IPM79_29820 [Polyangiaceae bacterium]|jgi:hypothetical protein|nr:hypothetical protein [Polyangiaceae bacterium]MBK8941689.1 hypothetical protein [Polyangiaceae bacterium]
MLKGHRPVPRSLVRSLSSALVVAALSATACNGASLSQGPSDTLRSYARALEDKRVEEAYRLLSDEARRSISLEAFRRMVLENPEDVMEVAKALARPASDPTVKATVTLPNGEELAMVFEDGRWRIDAAAIDLYGQATPRQALVGFLRAFERKRYDIMLRYVPDAEREGVSSSQAANAPPAAPPDGAPKDASAPVPADPQAGALTADKLRESWEGPQKEEMQRITQALRAALPTATIEEVGDVASMSYGSGHTVSFLRERGAWKIRDF